MRGIGEKLSEPLILPPLPAVLVNPGTALATKQVFAAWTPAAEPSGPFDLAAANGSGAEEFLHTLGAQANDLEAAAIKLAPVIAEVLAGLRALSGCRLARMSGSGATCFGLFSSAAEARAAAKIVQSQNPNWWVRACALG